MTYCWTSLQVPRSSSFNRIATATTRALPHDPRATGSGVRRRLTSARLAHRPCRASPRSPRASHPSPPRVRPPPRPMGTPFARFRFPRSDLADASRPRPPPRLPTTPRSSPSAPPSARPSSPWRGPRFAPSSSPSGAPPVAAWVGSRAPSATAEARPDAHPSPPRPWASARAPDSSATTRDQAPRTTRTPRRARWTTTIDSRTVEGAAAEDGSSASRAKAPAWKTTGSTAPPKTQAGAREGNGEIRANHPRRGDAVLGSSARGVGTTIVYPPYRA